MQHSLYKIINLTNGKFYVGSTQNPKTRFRTHRYRLDKNDHHCLHLQAAWNMYGQDQFLFRVIETFTTAELMEASEQKWLDEWVGKPECYNTAMYVGTPMRGQTHTDETKSLISQSRIGKGGGEDHYRFGKTVSEEMRKKIGDTQRGKPKKPGRKVSEAGMVKIRANIAAGRSHRTMAGKTHTTETRIKMSHGVKETTTDQTFASPELAGEAFGVKAHVIRKWAVFNAPVPPTLTKTGELIPTRTSPLVGKHFCYI